MNPQLSSMRVDARLSICVCLVHVSLVQSPNEVYANAAWEDAIAAHRIISSVANGSSNIEDSSSSDNGNMPPVFGADTGTTSTDLAQQQQPKIVSQTDDMTVAP
jgi:hypothetical protein